MEPTSIAHYIITFVFFIVLLIATLTLTMSVYNMDVSPTDTYAVDAQETIELAVVVGWASIALIILGLLGVAVLGFRGGFNYSLIKDGVKSITGEAKFFIALRVIVFVILLISSLILASLLSAAAEFILDSNNPSQYTQQYNDCLKFAKIMYLHIFLLISFQSLVYIYTYITKFE